MSRFSLRVAIAAVLVAVAAAAAGGVIAATRSSDEAALQPIRQPADPLDRVAREQPPLAHDARGEAAADRSCCRTSRSPDDEVAQGPRLDPQRHGSGEDQGAAAHRRRGVAAEIPLLFAFDTIHGFRTIFPIPLGTGASFDPQVASDDAMFGARESAAVGLKQTYAPMVDVSHEPRWGRIAEARRRGSRT